MVRRPLNRHLTFSVVVPCYGHERYVAEAIESVWAQTFRAFEIIAVDDGSPDGTAGILDDLAARSPVPMRVIHNANQGAHAALNAGAIVAAAPYLAFLNDDDRYEPDRLDVFARIAGKTRFSWGFSGIEPMSADGRPLGVGDVPDATRRAAIHWSRDPLEALRALPASNSLVTSGNLVVRTSLFAEVGGFRAFRFVHDWDLALRLLDVAKPYIVQRPLYLYRLHSENAFGGALTGRGARLAAGESEHVLRQRQERQTASPVSFVSLEVARWVNLASLDRDGDWAIRMTLRGLAKLRAIPPLYSAVRKFTRFARDIRRRAVRR
jgi:glycosyltransferase involved in cell wall biosynthesis